MAEEVRPEQIAVFSQVRFASIRLEAEEHGQRCGSLTEPK